MPLRLSACKAIPPPPLQSPCTDRNPPLPYDTCSRCYEVRCQSRSKVIDGYGNSFSRENCKAGDASVVLRTVDNCECLGASRPASVSCVDLHPGTDGTALIPNCPCAPQTRPLRVPWQRLQQQALVLRRQQRHPGHPF